MPVRMKCANAKCGKPLVIPDSARGKRVKCPSCGTVVAVPKAQPIRRAQGGQPVEPQAGGAAQTVRCPSCLADLPANAVICTNCGFNLKTGGRVHVSVGPVWEGGRSGFSPLATLRVFLTSNAKWLLVAALAVGVAVWFAASRSDSTTTKPVEPKDKEKDGPKGKEKDGPKDRERDKEKPKDNGAPPLQPEYPVLAVATSKAIMREETMEEPLIDEYLARLKGILRDSDYRLVESDKANWRFEVTMPEQPEPVPWYVLAEIEGEVRLDWQRPRPERVPATLPLPRQRLWVPWYYVFPSATPGVRVQWQKLTSARFEFPKEGGRVSFGGQELEVPAGAVADGTQVTVHYPYEDAKHPRAAKGLLHCVKVEIEGPSGLFSKPARLRLVSARLRAAGLVFQAHVARGGAKLTGTEGVAAILPRGRLAWASTLTKGTVNAWDPTVGLFTAANEPEPGWIGVSSQMVIAQIRAKNLAWHKEVAKYVGPTDKILPTVVGPYDGALYAVRREVQQALEAAEAQAGQVVVRIAGQLGSGAAEPREVRLAAVLGEAEAAGDLLMKVDLTRSRALSRTDAARIGILAQETLVQYAPPTLVASLTCRSPSRADGVAVDLAVHLHKMPLECLLYRLPEAQVVAGISFPITKPGVYSLTVEGGAGEEPGTCTAFAAAAGPPRRPTSLAPTPAEPKAPPTEPWLKGDPELVAQVGLLQKALNTQHEDKVEEPFVESYLERLKGSLKGALRLVEADKTNWDFEITEWDHREPEQRSAYVVAQARAKVRLARGKGPSGDETLLVPLETHRFLVPSYYVFPYAQGARVLSQKLLSACFDLGKDDAKVSYGGPELEIPAGAIPEGTRLTLRSPYEDPAAPRSGRVVHSFKVEVEPAVAAFSKPVTVRLATARIRAPARIWQAQIARRGLKLEGPSGIAAILPGGRVLWAGAAGGDPLTGWDPALGIAMGPQKPHAGWKEVPAQQRGTPGAALEANWRKEAEKHVGRLGQTLVPAPLCSSTGTVHVPGPELKQALQRAQSSRPSCTVRIVGRDGSGKTEAGPLDIAAAAGAGGVTAQLRDARSERVDIHDVDLGRMRMRPKGPPHVLAALTAAGPSGKSGNVAAEFAALLYEPLECVLYGLAEANVVTTLSFPITRPGVYSVVVEGDEVGEPTAKK